VSKKASCGDGWSKRRRRAERVPKPSALPVQDKVPKIGPPHTRGRVIWEVCLVQTGESGNLARSSMKAKRLTILRLRL
jgi:hypothetical protein